MTANSSRPSNLGEPSPIYILAGVISLGLAVPGVLLSIPEFETAPSFENRTPPQYLVVANYSGAPENASATWTVSHSADLTRGTDSFERILITVQPFANNLRSIDIYRAPGTDASSESFDSPGHSSQTIEPVVDSGIENWCYVVLRDGDGTILALPGNTPRVDFSPLTGLMPKSVASELANSLIYEDRSSVHHGGMAGSPWTESVHIDLGDPLGDIVGVACTAVGDLAKVFPQGRRFYSGVEVGVLQQPVGRISVVAHDGVDYPGDWEEQDVVASRPARLDVSYEGIPVSGGLDDEFAPILGFEFASLAAVDSNERDAIDRGAWLGALLLGAWVAAILALPFVTAGRTARRGTAVPARDLSKRTPHTVRRLARARRSR